MVETNLPKILRQMMSEKGVNQVALSKEIGVAQSAISAWILGKKEPSISSLWRLADYFDCSIDELVGRREF